MPDFRVADTAPEHPKLRAAGLAAFGLWAAAGAYAMRELTDGWVPDYWIQTWPAGKRQASALVRVGLWRNEPRHGMPGYRFHDWDEYQRPAEKIHEDRRKGRERAAKSRRTGQRSGERNAEPSGEASPEPEPHVRAQSHDSLPLALQSTTQVGQSGPSTERADREGAPTGQQPIPDGWTPHAGHVRTASHRRLNLEHEAAQFVAHAQANDRRAADWDAAFSVWLGNAKPNGPNPWLRTSNGTDANIAALIAAGQPDPGQPRAIGSGS